MATSFVISKHFYAHVVPRLCQFFHAHIRPRLRSFDILYLSMVLGIAYSAIIFFTYRRFQKLKDPYKLLRTEWKFLNALIEDAQTVSESGKKIDEKAHQLWDSQLRPTATVHLSDAEREWVDAIKIVVRNAGICIETYKSLSGRRQFLRWVYSGLMDFRKIRGLHAELEGVIGEIKERYTKKRIHRIDIYGSLERSRSNVRSLQDRPISEQNSFTYNRTLPPTVSIEKKLNDLIHGKPDLVRGRKEDLQYYMELPLKQLLAFLEDLDGLRMESETEKAWVKHAEEAIQELQHDMDRIMKIANRIRWLFYLGNWIARRQLKKWYDYHEIMLRILIVRKNSFAFKFIRRDPLKSVHPSPKKQTFPSQSKKTDDIDLVISSHLNDFRNQLNQEQDMDQFRQLHGHFERVHKRLKDAKAVESIKHSRLMDRKNQLKNILIDAEKSMTAYRESSPSEWGENQYKTDSRSKSKAEIDRFNTALAILEISTNIFRTELRRERNLVVGMEEDIHELLSRLMNNSENCSKHFIVGMKGIGKTTLAKSVYKHKAIQNHYKFKAWVSLPDKGSDDNVLPKILGNQLLPTDEKRNENENWIRKVNDYLRERKYLVVLDNISTKEAWDCLKAAFPESTDGSRIVVTTRDKSVASHADQNSIPYQLPLRTKDESLKLFQQMVSLPPEPSNEPELSPEVERQNVWTLARKVVGRCGGLPLSILRLGYLMSGKKKVTSEEWTRVLEHIDHNQTSWSETLALNEKDLPLHLVKCLSYFGLFPRDSEIPARRLVALWVAEGLVQQSGVEQEPLESVAQEYLKELISRNLIQVVERKLNRKVKTCGFPSALREPWLRSHPNSSLDQRLAHYFDENDGSSSQSHGSSKNLPNLLRSCRNPRSILFFDPREGDKPGEDIGNFLCMGIASGHLLQLQVLDLEYVFRPQLPRNIGQLIQLTYLGLRWTYLETIPSSIGNLLNLQTLDVRHTYIRILPSSIWKLQKLRHLYMNQIYRSKIVHQPNGNSLQNLQTLRGAFVDKDSPLKDGLRRLTNLRKLALTFQLSMPQQNSLAKSILKLNHLQTLKLKSIDEMGRPQDLKATFLSGLENLSNLYLFGKLENPSINGLPNSLTDLTLSTSRLSDDPMPALQKLRNLKWLSLYSGSYTGRIMSCSKGGFPQLHVLNFWMLQELEEWDVEEQAMPNLKKLEIRSCKNLKVPTGLKYLKNLGELKLKDMPVEFTEEIQETKEKIWGKIAHAPSIIIDKQ